jgi:hypothetical protein
MDWMVSWESFFVGAGRVVVARFGLFWGREVPEEHAEANTATTARRIGSDFLVAAWLNLAKEGRGMLV